MCKKVVFGSLKTNSFFSFIDKSSVDCNPFFPGRSALSGEASITRNCSILEEMLSAESQVDVTLGLWKNIGVISVLFISMRSLGS